MIDIGLVLSRLLQYVATTTLFGAALFPLYAYRGREPDRILRWRRRVLFSAALLAIVSGISWFLFSVASMSGDVSGLVDPDTLLLAGHTSFGTLWTWRMLLALLMVVLMNIGVAHVAGTVMISLLAAVLLLSLAGTGHTQVEEGWAGIVHVLADGAHLLAAGAWLGGLLPLANLVAHYCRKPDDASPLDNVLVRFSGMGYLAVATLVGTGLINSWLLVGSVSGLLKTGYGQFLVVKLALFLGMVGLAVANRFWLIPALEKASTAACHSGAIGYLRKLRNHIVGEQLLGFMVLFVVSILGTMQPAIVP
jgi:putative copper resistance protein D